MWRRVTRWLLALPLALVPACSALTNLDDLNGGGGTDAGGDTAGAGNLFTNPDFEDGAGGCGPGWTGDRATLTRSTTAHSGQSSCQVCVQSGETLFNLFRTSSVVASAQVGDTYFVQAWISTVAGMPTSDLGMQVDEGQTTSIGYTQADVNAAPGWQQLQFNALVDTQGATLDWALHGATNTAGSGCYLIDDTQFIKQ